VEPFTGQIHAEFIDRLQAPQFQTFLEGVIALYPGPRKILLVLDNARAHHAKILQPFLETVKEKLELVFLPPYSPNLNPIERFWRFMRKMVTHNTFFATFAKLLTALTQFFQKFKCPSLEIASLCKVL
jgi:transposase